LPSQLLFSTNNQEVTEISGRKGCFFQSEVIMEIYFCRRPSLTSVSCFRVLNCKKIIEEEEEEKCDENAKVFGAEISLNDASVRQKSPSSDKILSSCHPVILSDCQTV